MQELICLNKSGSAGVIKFIYVL